MFAGGLGPIKKEDAEIVDEGDLDIDDAPELPTKAEPVAVTSDGKEVTDF